MEEKKVIDALLNYGFSRRRIKKLITIERKRRRAVFKAAYEKLKKTGIEKLLHDLY